MLLSRLRSLIHPVDGPASLFLLNPNGLVFGETPFIGFAGGNLLVQDNQQVDIVALIRPESGLFSYGDLVLRSAVQVGGDTHYVSGGDFWVEYLDGSDGKLFSPIDPIIRALGDVTIREIATSTPIAISPNAPAITGSPWKRGTIAITFDV